jgi:hypothetical protein
MVWRLLVLLLARPRERGPKARAKRGAAPSRRSAAQPRLIVVTAQFGSAETGATRSAVVISARSVARASGLARAIMPILSGRLA